MPAAVQPWLRKETIGSEDRTARLELEARMKLWFSADDHERLRRQFTEAMIARRRVLLPGPDGEVEERVWGRSIGELELEIQNRRTLIEEHRPPAGMHPQDLYFATEVYQKLLLTGSLGIEELQRVRERLKARLHQFLVETETAIAFSETAASTFERVRAYVDGQLTQLAPEALEQLRGAYTRASAGDAESLAHALLSCRRVLKSLADLVYPATGLTVVGSDGKERAMTDDKFVHRLWQFVAQHQPSTNARHLAHATLAETGRRVDALYNLASQGVHDTVTGDQVDQCVLQTYLLVGQILKLRDSLSSRAT